MADNKDTNKENQLNIELQDKMADGEYANLVMIAHSAEEFIMDFIRVMPGVPSGRVKSRIIVTPAHAKRFLRALADNVERYERAHGEIHVPAGPGTTIEFGGGHVGRA